VMAVFLGVMFGKTSFECSTSQAHHAAAHGLCDVLHVLFEAGSDLSQLLPRTGRSPLHVAVAKKQVGAVTKLLDLGADPWIEDDEGAPPLTSPPRATRSRPRFRSTATR
jgi:ankyrin repeat protein